MGREHIGFVELSGTGAGERALHYALRRGYQVTVFSRGPGGLPARGAGAAAGEAALIGCETNDPAAIIAAIRAAGLSLTGVTTTHDFYVPQAAAVARALSLPGLDPEAALDARSKIRMRQRLERAAPALNPRWTTSPAGGDARAVAGELGLPLVGKPSNANDSWGVALLHSVRDVADYLEAARAWDRNSVGQRLDRQVLFEEFLDGHEYSVETTQPQGGHRTCMGVTGKPLQRSQGHFAEAEVVFPVAGDEAAAGAAAADAALDALGLTVGTMHTELRVVGGAARVLEVNPRLAGDMTGSHMIELALGASPIEQLVDIALGQSPPWAPARRHAAASAGVPLPRAGRFLSLDNRDELLAMPGVDEVRVMAGPGAACHVPPRSNEDYAVRVVAGGKTSEQALDLARSAAAAARLSFAEAGS
jgi:biotin carboxylase